jgi:hypothetical protein
MTKPTMYKYCDDVTLYSLSLSLSFVVLFLSLMLFIFHSLRQQDMLL